MSILPQISEEQKIHNISKLISQNKKLRQEIQSFEEQINSILSPQSQEKYNKLPSQQLDDSSWSIKKASSKNQEHSVQKLQRAPQNKLEFTNESIKNLLQNNSPLLYSQVIPALKQRVEELKNLNVKQNVHYILKQEDELKIIKKQLQKFRKEKEVVSHFIKDKSIKLQKQNNQLISHKKELEQQLANTIKFNRQSSSQITELQRNVRKYHTTLIQFKKISLSTTQTQDTETIRKIRTDPEKYLNQLEQEIQNLKTEISQTELKWKESLDTLDKEYYQLKDSVQTKQRQSKQIQNLQNYFKTRILVIKNQQLLQKERQRKKLVKVSPKLKKQLEEYINEEKKKLLKKQQYLKKHLPRQHSQQITSSPENKTMETYRDDKNIIKLKNYYKPKQKANKEVEANLNYQPQKFRHQRSWSFNPQQNSNNLQKISFHFCGNKDAKTLKKTQIFLKSIKLGTTSYDQTINHTSQN